MTSRPLFPADGPAASQALPEAESLFLSRIRESCRFGLLEEVYTTPKPGLVDRHDSGAHKDMDCALFEASERAVTPYIAQMAQAGWRHTGELSALFPSIRPLGLQCERAMFQATGGVNTHKGIIFSLGIIASCLGYARRRLGPIPPSALFSLCKRAVRPWLLRDFEEMGRREPKTHGERLFAQYGIRGIRGEAMDGFPSLSQAALPAMERALSLQPTPNSARLAVLLTLMSQVDDTNILTRSDPATLAYVKARSQDFLRRHPIIGREALQELEEMNRDFIRRNISPGGCADLLAIAIFFRRLSELEAGD